MGIVSAVVGQAADVSVNTFPFLFEETPFVKVELIIN
jgi:hypothetical protein